MIKKLLPMFSNVGLAVLSGYLVICFIHWDMNPGTWVAVDRGMFLFVTCFMGLFYHLEARAYSDRNP